MSQAIFLVPSRNDRIPRDYPAIHTIARQRRRSFTGAITGQVLLFVLGWPIPTTMALLSSAKCCVAISLGLQTQSDHQGRIAVR